MAAQTINGTDSVAFRYDADGLLIGAGTLTVTRDTRNGLPTGTILGTVTTGETYNEYGERRSISASYNGTALFSTTYTRDAGGRIEALTETVGEVSTTYGYGYDTAGRLREVRKDGAVATVYEYDDNGNRKRVTTPTGAVEGSTDTQDRLVSYGDAIYGYTDAGDLLYKAVGADTTRYRYDALGNLLEVVLPSGSRVEYVVDAESRRVGRRVDGRLVQGFLWEGSLRLVAELDSTGAVVARFVYGDRPNVPEYMIRVGRTYRLLHDHLGSVRLVVDASTGEVTQRIDYDAYGQVVQDTRPGFQPFGYAGGLYDERTRLVRFGARDYDAHTGRWTAKDPILFNGGDPNLYGYAGQNPVNAVDPRGTYTLAEHATAMNGWGTLGSQAAWNFGFGCASGFGSALMKNTLMGGETSRGEAFTQCMVGGVLASSSFVASGWAGRGYAMSKTGKIAFGRIGIQHFTNQRELWSGIAAGCLFAVGEGVATEGITSSALGSEPDAIGAAGTFLSGCASGAWATTTKNPVAAAIIGAMAGAAIELFAAAVDAGWHNLTETRYVPEPLP
jgi:RHS repeat-associated protein